MEDTNQNSKGIENVIKGLAQHGKSSGQVSTGDILEAMGEIDFDPDEKLPIEVLRKGVKDIKKILDNLNLRSFLKTSGGKGYHIVVPFKSGLTWTKFYKIAENVALLMESTYPDKYTTNIRKEKRKGKIFIDYLRNQKGATSVAPYSIRLKKNAPVSMPISWKDLDKIAPNEITMDKAIKLIKKKDPWKDFFTSN